MVFISVCIIALFSSPVHPLLTRLIGFGVWYRRHSVCKEPDRKSVREPGAVGDGVQEESLLHRSRRYKLEGLSWATALGCSRELLFHFHYQSCLPLLPPPPATPWPCEINEGPCTGRRSSAGVPTRTGHRANIHGRQGAIFSD